MRMWLSEKRCYELLDLRPPASHDEIKRAYLDSVSVWHPDRFSQNPRLRKKAEERLKEINSAYEFLLAKSDQAVSGSEPKQRTDPAPGWNAPPSSYHGGPAVGPWAPASSILEASPLRRFIALLCVLAGFAFLVRDFGTVETIRKPLSAASTKPAPDSEKPTAPAEAVDPASSGARYFTLGSTKAEVLAVQGTPDGIRPDGTFQYGVSTVTFGPDGRVTRWRSTRQTKLKVRSLPMGPVVRRQYFTLGSTRDEVLAVQGTPDCIKADGTFQYGVSTVTFGPDGAVTRWQSLPPGRLKVMLSPKASVKPLEHFTLGSTRDEVLAVQGTPDCIKTDGGFMYGPSSVSFGADGRVRSWNSIPRGRLKVKIPLPPEQDW